MDDRTTGFERWLARSDLRWKMVEWLSQFGCRLHEARLRFIFRDDE